MRKLLALTLLLSPLLAGLAFPAVGDTVLHEGVYYVVTKEVDSIAAYEVAIDHMTAQPYIGIPASIDYSGNSYCVTSHTGTSVLPLSFDYDNPVHITKIDFSNAVNIKELPPVQYMAIAAVRVDTFVLPPAIETYEAPLSISDPRDPDPLSGVLNNRPYGITRLFSSGNKLRHVDFSRGKSLVEVDISSSSVDSLTEHSTWGAFHECYWLERVRLPESVRHFGYNAFLSCIRLDADSINMPDSLASIDGYCFNADWRWDTLRLPAKVSRLDYKFITSHTFLECIEVDPDNRWFKSMDGTLYTKSGMTVFKIPFSLNHGDTFFFREEVDSIAPYVHTDIGNGFYTGMLENPNEIHDFVFNTGLRQIGNCAFRGSTIRTALNFGSTSVSSIPAFCFATSDLGGIELPIELSSIGSWAFDRCLRLDSVRFLGSVVSSIAGRAFSACTSLDSLDLSAQTRLRTISAYLCAGDSSLRSVKLPTSIDSISRCAFVDCVSLSEIEVPVLDPITIEENVFSGVDKSSCRLIVPAPSIDKYRAAPVWRDFLRIEAGRDMLTLTVLSADTLMGGVRGSGVYSPREEVFAGADPVRGYRFTHWSDGSTEQYRRVALTSDSTLTAYFELNPEFQYRVSVRTADPAMGSVSPTTAYARHGETVTITATPLSGYRFTLWSDSVTANPRDIIVTRDTVLTAHFAPCTPDTFTVTLLCDSVMGTVSGAGRYPEGSAATLTATPKTGYAFTRWEDNHGLTFTDNPLTLTVTCDTTLTALFRENGTGFDPAAADSCAAWVTPDGTLRVRCPGCRLMELRTVTGLTLYSGAPADIPLPMPGIYILTLDGRTIKIIRP